MGITVSRYCAAKSEMATFPPVSPKFANANWKPSLTTKIVFEGLNPRNPFYLTPYVTAGLSQVNELNGAGTDYKMSSKPKFDAGIDAKYSLTNNLTMDVTLNTDFAQVEADDQKINLTRYSLFFPEKRVFFQEKGDDYLTLRLAQTMENGSKNKMNDLSPSRVLVQWEKRKQKGFSYDFSYGYSGTSFNPGVGFEYLQNYQTVHGKLRYGWFPGENARILINRLSVTGYNIWDTSTGKQETASGMLTWAFEAKKGYSGSIDGTWNQEDLLDTLILGNDQAIVPPGRYSFTYLTAMYTTSASHALGGEFMGEAGNFYDGWNLQFVNHIAGIKGLLTLSTKTSFSAFIQYNTAISKFVTNIRLRWNPREGNDFYIVYNEGLNSNIRREVPYLPYSIGRTVLLKYTYTFRLQKH